MLLKIALLCAVLSMVAAVRTPKKSTTPAKPKVSCRICNGLGDDCKGGTVRAGCDACCKLTGVVDDVKEVPDAIADMIEKDSPGTLTKMQKFKGKKVTIRACATPALLDLVDTSSYEGYGCSELEDLFGFSDVTACLCPNECK